MSQEALPPAVLLARLRLQRRRLQSTLGPDDVFEQVVKETVALMYAEREDIEGRLVEVDAAITRLELELMPEPATAEKT